MEAECPAAGEESVNEEEGPDKMVHVMSGGLKTACGALPP